MRTTRDVRQQFAARRGSPRNPAAPSRPAAENVSESTDRDTPTPSARSLSMRLSSCRWRSLIIATSSSYSCSIGIGKRVADTLARRWLHVRYEEVDDDVGAARRNANACVQTSLPAFAPSRVRVIQRRHSRSSRNSSTSRWSRDVVVTARHPHGPACFAFRSTRNSIDARAADAPNRARFRRTVRCSPATRADTFRRAAVAKRQTRDNVDHRPYA